jgi:hypothetical protein
MYTLILLRVTTASNCDNAKVATVLGSILASSDTVDLRAVDEAVLFKVLFEKSNKIPLLNKSMEHLNSLE